MVSSAVTTAPSGVRDRHDLGAEVGGGGVAVRGGGELVDGLAVEFPTRGHQFGRDALRHQTGRVPFGDRWAVRVLPDAGGEHRDAAHRFDAGRHDDVACSGDHGLCGEVGGLLAGSAGAMHRHRWHALGQPRRKPRPAPDRAGLFTDLAHAAGDDVVDARRIDVVARHQLADHLTQQLDWMHAAQRPAGTPVLGWLALGHRRSKGIDNDCAT